VFVFDRKKEREKERERNRRKERKEKSFLQFCRPCVFLTDCGAFRNKNMKNTPH
jgi:hypothetical protein